MQRLSKWGSCGLQNSPLFGFHLAGRVWADLGIRRFDDFSNYPGRTDHLCAGGGPSGVGKFEVLYVVMFAIFKVIFEMAYQTYIPEIVTGELWSTPTARSGCRMPRQSAGPGLAGIMVGRSHGRVGRLPGFLCAGCLLESGIER
jgi:hypothetical protein